MFVSQQTLLIENAIFVDSALLQDVCESQTQSASIRVQMLKHEDPHILNDNVANRACLAQALKMFWGCPVFVNFTFHATTFELGRSESEVIDGRKYEPLDRSMILELVPWRKAFGIQPGSISVVLCLAVDYSLIYDGWDYLAAVVMLADGQIAAMTAFVQEFSFDFHCECTMSRLLIVATLQDLLEQSPGIVNAMLKNNGPRLPISAPIRILLDDPYLPYGLFCDEDRFNLNLHHSMSGFLGDVISIDHAELPAELRAAVLEYRVQVAEPWGKDKLYGGGCIRCGCTSQFDKHGDRICWCDACRLEGCRSGFVNLRDISDSIPHLYVSVFGGKREIYCDEWLLEKQHNKVSLS